MFSSLSLRTVVTIGFDCNGSYSVSEGQGVVLIPVELMSGELEREVVTQLIYKNGSAICMLIAAIR